MLHSNKKEIVTSEEILTKIYLHEWNLESNVGSDLHILVPADSSKLLKVEKLSKILLLWSCLMDIFMAELISKISSFYEQS